MGPNLGKNGRHAAHKTIAENFTDLENEMNSTTQKVIRNATRYEQIRMSPWHLEPGQQKYRETGLKAVRGNNQLTYRDTTTRVTSGLSSVTSSQGTME